MLLKSIIQVLEERTGQPDETSTGVRIIHIYLDEGDLHFRGRQWLAEDDTNVILQHEDLTCTGTSYSEEFADVLKKIFGHIPHTDLFTFLSNEDKMRMRFKRKAVQRRKKKNVNLTGRRQIGRRQGCPS